MDRREFQEANEVEGGEHYQPKISKSFAALENLDDSGTLIGLGKILERIPNYS
jgi:hypothetical protein